MSSTWSFNSSLLFICRFSGSTWWRGGKEYHLNAFHFLHFALQFLPSFYLSPFCVSFFPSFFFWQKFFFIQTVNLLLLLFFNLKHSLFSLSLWWHVSLVLLSFLFKIHCRLEFIEIQLLNCILEYSSLCPICFFSFHSRNYNCNQ